MGYFEIQKKVLRINGISIDGYHNTAYKVYSIFMVCFFITAYPVLNFFELFRHDSMEVISNIILYATAGASAMSKTLVVIANRMKIKQVLSKLEQKPFLPDLIRGGEEEHRLIKECVWITNTQTYTYLILTSATIGITVLASVVKKISDSSYRDFPYGPFTPLNITNDFNYDICWLYQSCSISVIASAYVSTDLLIGAVLAHITYQYKILQNFIRKLVEASHEDTIRDDSSHNSKTKVDTSTIPWKYLQKTLAAAVSYHVEILNVASEIEKTLSLLLLTIFLQTLILICMSIYHASLTTSGILLMRYMGEMIACALQVAVVCYWGEQITRDSEKVGFAVYESNFPGTDLRFQKGLTMIMLRSQDPTVITAGKFTNIGLPTFLWILRNSYSAFMVMRSSNGNN